MLDETWSFGVLGRTGRGLTEAQNVDPTQVDMIIGSLAGPLCAGGGFCAGAKDVVEHQRVSSTAYTFSAALPAMLAVTASESINLLQSNPEILLQCRENIRFMRAQLDPRSDWVMCTSAPENPIMVLVFKPEVVNARRLGIDDQERLLQECVDEVCFFSLAYSTVQIANTRKRRSQTVCSSRASRATPSRSTPASRTATTQWSPRSRCASRRGCPRRTLRRRASPSGMPSPRS
jgi:7-keto-8-aminopelargonate synthetase-like enzyme